jgi:hypothetical protein
VSTESASDPEEKKAEDAAASDEAANDRLRNLLGD